MEIKHGQCYKYIKEMLIDVVHEMLYMGLVQNMTLKKAETRISPSRVEVIK